MPFKSHHGLLRALACHAEPLMEVSKGNPAPAHKAEYPNIRGTHMSERRNSLSRLHLRIPMGHAVGYQALDIVRAESFVRFVHQLSFTQA